MLLLKSGGSMILKITKLILNLFIISIIFSSNTLKTSAKIPFDILKIVKENQEPDYKSCSQNNNYNNKKNLNNNHTNKSLNSAEETYTIIIYMCADNDLFPFAGRNIAQLKRIGSNSRIKIAVNLDMHRPGQPKKTKRLLIEKNKYTQIGNDLTMDSGDAQSLIDCCRWAITSYPSKNYILVLWNHGTGILEPAIKRAINPAKLFSFDPKTKLINLNRSKGFLDFINQEQQESNQNIISQNLQNNISNNPLITSKQDLEAINVINDFEDEIATDFRTNIATNYATTTRGICFDDSTGNYLTNLSLQHALKTICNNYLGGNKFAIIACDACLMSMLEVAIPLEKYAHYFVSSQEVELGTGYNYEAVLMPFLNKTLSKSELAQHIVKAYQEAYGRITHDYTQSAIDLSKIKALESNLQKLSSTLTYGLKNQKNKTVKEAIQLSKHKNFCTHFDEPTYIDLNHFYSNLHNNMSNFRLNDNNATNHFKATLEQVIKEGQQLISKVVIANTAGQNLRNAKGISIYFPEHHIHSSYYRSDVALNSGWLGFLKQYMS